MTAFPNAMATRNRFLTTAKALERALRQAEFDRPATDSAPYLFPCPVIHAFRGWEVGAVYRGIPQGRILPDLPASEL
jgi:hypothetical protein